jgi:hypothetical protein
MTTKAVDPFEDAGPGFREAQRMLKAPGGSRSTTTDHDGEEVGRK